MSPMSEIRNQLKKLVRVHGEREKPFAFAGRKDIIRNVLEATEILVDGPIRGQTFVISGAPGAGKTALLDKISEQEGFGCIHFEEIPTDNQVKHAWYRLAAHFTGESVESFRTTLHSEHSSEAGLDALVGAKARYTKGTSLDSPDIDAFTEIAISKKASKQPVMVCIDEIQNLKSHSKAAEFVRHLHTQSIAPVLLVCAGLSNSKQSLANIGVSRSDLRNDIFLGPLHPEETMQAAQEALTVIARQAEVREQGLVDMFAADIATASDNWPRHLTCYLHGVCEALIEQDRPSLPRLDQANALAYGENLRIAYYQQRLIASRLPVQLLHQLYRQISAVGLSNDDCADMLQAQFEESHGSILKRRFESGEDALDQALRAGVLTLNSSYECEIPIPSFQTFVDERMNAHFKEKDTLPTHKRSTH